MLSSIQIVWNQVVRGRSSVGLRLAGLAVLGLLAAPSASANTYLFSFTTADLLSALQASDPAYSASGFFSVFLKPTSGLINFTTFGSESSGYTTGSSNNDYWQGTTINDPTDLGAGTWVQFSKYNDQLNVSLISGATNNGALPDTIFMPGANGGCTVSPSNCTYHDSGVPPQPLMFGSTTGKITHIIAGNAIWQFTLDADGISGPVTFSGLASAIVSSSTTRFNLSGLAGNKTDLKVAFTLDLTPSTPEPETWLLFAFGSVLVLVSHAFKHQRTRRAPSRRDTAS